MAQLDNRPELPDIFPQDEVTVEGEEHVFQVAELDSGTQAQYEYTLDKAPIEEIQSVQGLDQDANSRTFSNGVDYELTQKTETVIGEFTYDSDEDEYLLRYPLDTGTDSIVDESGDTYSSGTDYVVRDGNHYGDSIVWLDGGDSPENNETFTVSYDVTFPSSVLQWQTDGNNLPQANSTFYVTYRADSIISRYQDAHEDSLDSVEEALQEVINNKFVDQSSGEALDELGKLFGPTIGKRRGRNDQQYRIYLKSIVQSFVSRGTVNGIKLAISTATEVPFDDIVINENFEDVEYEVQIQAATPVIVELLEEVAEIADPSGVDQVRTRFIVDPDEMVVRDQLSITEGNQISEDMAVADVVAVNDNKFGPITDEIGVADATAVDPNRAELNETLATDDTSAIDPNLTEIAENVNISEILNVEPSNKNAHEWEDDGEPSTTGWNFFEWTEIIDFARTASDTTFADDAATISAKAAIIAETGGSADGVNVRFNVESVSDTAFADDVVTIPPTDATTTDTGGSADAVTNISSTLVAWDTNDWGALEWTQQHN